MVTINKIENLSFTEYKAWVYSDYTLTNSRRYTALMIVILCSTTQEIKDTLHCLLKLKYIPNAEHNYKIDLLNKSPDNHYHHITIFEQSSVRLITGEDLLKMDSTVFSIEADMFINYNKKQEKLEIECPK